MAEINFHGLGELRLSMQEVADIPEDVQDEMLNAGADIVVAAQRAEAAKLGKEYRNPGQTRDYSTGGVLASIRKGKVKLDKMGNRVLYITPQGSRTRGGKRKNKDSVTTRNAEIAFLNEYGTKTIRARGWMRKANESCAAESTAAQAAVYDRFLKSKNL